MTRFQGGNANQSVAGILAAYEHWMSSTYVPTNLNTQTADNTAAGATEAHRSWIASASREGANLHSSTDWPTTGWGYSFEIAATDASLEWNVWFNRYDSTGQSPQVAETQMNATAWTGTGIKSATGLTWSAVNSDSSRAADDSFVFYLMVTNTNMMTLFTSNTYISDSDNWAENTNFTPPLSGTSLDASFSGSATLSAGASKTATVGGTPSATASTSSTASLTRPLDATLAVTATVTADASVSGAPVDVDGSLAVSASATTQAALAAVVGASGAVSATLSSTAERTATVAGTTAVTATQTATAQSTRTVQGSLPVTASLAADAQVLGRVDIDGSLAVTATTTAVAGLTVEASGSLAVTATPTTTGTRIAPAAGATSVTASSTAAAERTATTGAALSASATLGADAEVVSLYVVHSASGVLGATATGTAEAERARELPAAGQATATIRAEAEVRTPISMEAHLQVTASAVPQTAAIKDLEAVGSVHAFLGTQGDVVVKTWRFECPTRQKWTTAPPLIKRPPVAVTQGVSVARVNGSFRNVKGHRSDQLAAAGTEGQDYFLGGYTYEIPYSVAQELIAAGYSPTEI